MRNQQRAGAGIEERSRQPRPRFGAGLFTGDGIAGGQNHPVGVEFQLRDFARGQQAVVEFGWLFWNAQHQRGFGEALYVAGDEPVGGEIDDRVIGERRTLDGGLAGIAAEMNVGGGNAEIFATALSSSAVSGSCGKAAASLARSTPAPCQKSV